MVRCVYMVQFTGGGLHGGVRESQRRIPPEQNEMTDYL